MDTIFADAIMEKLCTNPGAIIDQCLPTVRHLCESTKSPVLIGDRTGMTLPNLGFQDLLAKISATSQLPAGLKKTIEQKVLALFLVYLFPGMWESVTVWHLFSERLTADLCGEVKRGKSKAEVTASALTPLELALKWTSPRS